MRLPTTPRRNPSRLSPWPRSSSTRVLVFAAIALTGCKEETSTLFDENGTWELTRYTIDAMAGDVTMSDARRESFLMKFEDGVVQTAMCGEDSSQTPNNASCRTLPGETSWFCNCFAYAFEESTMVWKEFEAGKAPPPVSIDDASMNMGDGSGGGDTGDGGGADTGGDEGGGGTGSVSTITVSAIEDVSNTYVFQPLPTGIFGSDGATATYTFVRKAASRFEQVYEDPDGRPSCEPCT